MLGAMSSMIAALELIQCRVVYLPTEMDPIYSYQEQLYLTPNSVNLHARRISLFPNLFLSGFTETPVAIMGSSQLSNMPKSFHEEIMLQKLPTEMITNESDNDEIDGVEVSSGMSSIKIIEEIINHHSSTSATTQSLYVDPNDQINSNITSTSKISKKNISQGIFILNYKYTHTLNHFLFHMPEKLEQAGINVCIAVSAIPPPSSSHNNDDKNQEKNQGTTTSINSSLHLPKKFGSLNIVTPVSLKLQKQYIILKFFENDYMEWIFDKSEIVEL
jgi:hypothetical protein